MSDARDVEIHKDPAKGYGFNLSRLGDVHFIRVAEEGGAAYVAGGRPGDRILGVNGQDVTSVSHDNLVRLIKTAGNILRMKLRAMTPDEIAKLQAESTAGNGSATADNAAASTPSGGAKKQQRHAQQDGCVRILLNKTERGFGFNLSRIDGKHVFRVLEPGGAAQAAGAAPGDEIVAVGNTYVEPLEHADVVNLIKVAGSSVEMTIRPRPAGADKPVFMEHVTAGTDPRRMARAQQQTADDIARRTRQLELDRQEEKSRQRRQIFEQERERLKRELDKALKDAEVAKRAARYSRNEAKSLASERELTEMDQVMQGLTESMTKELKLKHQRPLPEDAEEVQLERLRRDLERAVLDDEIHQVQKIEWGRYLKDYEKRKVQDERDEVESQRRLEEARKKDLQILQQKQARMASMLEEAQRRREEEVEEARRRREAEMEDRKKEMAERLAKSQAAARAREEQLQRDREEEAMRARRDEEARQAREFDEAERRRKAEQRAKGGPAAAQEEEEDDHVPAFRSQLRKTAGPQSGNKSHPMVQQATAMRKAGGPSNFRMPVSSNMRDTAM